MAKNLEELWEERKANQTFPLIGTNIPGNGNGFHDRISFDISYDREGVNWSYNSWLYSVYFRDMINLSNPNYRMDDGKAFLESIKLEGFSSEYRETLIKYYTGKRSYGKDFFLSIISDWFHDLINYGRVVIEFVGWYDNKSHSLYAYELERLDTNCCKIKRNTVVQTGIFIDADNNRIKITRTIPRSKCIILEWPKELGGYKNYKKTAKKGSSIYTRQFENASETWTPRKALDKLNRRKLTFNQLISDWGTNHPADNTTNFYKICTNLKFKLTMIYCMQEVCDGVKDLVELLGEKLNESGSFSIENPDLDIEQFKKGYEAWISGQMSIEEAKVLMKF